jgi:hypothetical protein
MCTLESHSLAKGFPTRDGKEKTPTGDDTRRIANRTQVRMLPEQWDFQSRHVMQAIRMRDRPRHYFSDGLGRSKRSVCARVKRGESIGAKIAF